MKRKIEYLGAPIDIPYLVSGIQDNTEEYVGYILDLLTPGVVLRSHLDQLVNGKLYVSGGDLHLSSCSLIFGSSPKKIFRTPDVTVRSNIASYIGTNETFNWHVWVYISSAGAGINKVISNKFVYNQTLPSVGPSASEDVLNFAISASVNDKPTNGVYLGFLHYYTVAPNQADTEYVRYYSASHIYVNQLSCDRTVLNLDAIHGDKLLSLNNDWASISSSSPAGIQVIDDRDIENGENHEAVARFLYDGTRWSSNLRISGLDPVDDHDLTTKQWVEEYVDTALTYQSVPCDFRMYDVNSGTKASNVQTGISDKVSGKTLNQDNSINVKLMWGRDDILGTASMGTNVFNVTNQTFVASTYSIVGMRGQVLYIPVYDKSFLITSNTTTALTLADLNGDPITFDRNLSFTSVDHASNPVLHSNADRYQVKATPMATGSNTPLEEESLSFEFITGIKPSYLRGEINLSVGTKYDIKIRSVKNGVVGTWTPLSDGTFVKHFTKSNTDSTITYINPYLAVPPAIPRGTGDIEFKLLSGGFKITIPDTMWKDAESFGYIYCLKSVNNNPTFNSTFTEKFSEAPTMEETVAVTGTTVIKVRPLIAGYEVYDPADGEVSTTTTVDDQVSSIWNGNVEVSTMEGELEYTTELPARWKLHSLVVPAYSGDSLAGETAIPFGGDDIILLDGDYECISYYKGNTGCYLYNVHSKAMITAANGAVKPFSVGTSLLGRTVCKITMTSTKRIVGIDVNVNRFDKGNSSSSVKGLIRAYPSGAPSDVDSLVLEGIGKPALSVPNMDFIVNAGEDLVIDFYDPDNGEASNAISINADITVWARPASAVTRTPGDDGSLV